MVQVSVITPSYNAAQFIEATLQSVMTQTFSDWELIVVDDCSTDGSADLAESVAAHDSRISVIRLQRNSGAAAARNVAIKAAKGRYIAFLDSDDLWLPCKLERQLLHMQKHGAALSFTAYEKIDEFGRSLGLMGVPKQVDYRELLKTCVIGCLTAMYDVEQLGKVYMPVNTSREDYGTWLNILKQVDRASGLNEVLAQYRVYSHQSSGKKTRMAAENWKLFRKIERLGMLRSCYYFGHYAVRGLLRTKFPRLARMLRVLI